MQDALIIFDIPKSTNIKTISPFLTDENTIKGTDFLIVMAPQSILNKLKENNSKPQFKQTFEMCTIKDLEGKVSEGKKLELVRYEAPNNELFFLQSENISYVFLSDFTGNLVKTAQFRGPITVSNTGKFIIHDSYIYSGSDWQVYGMVAKGNAIFSQDDKFLMIDLGNRIICVYETDTMQFFEHEDVSKVMFGKDVFLIDDFLVELEKGAASFYKNLINGFSPNSTADAESDNLKKTEAGPNEKAFDDKDQRVAEPDSAAPEESKTESDTLVEDWMDSDAAVEAEAENENFPIPEYEAIHFSPYGYDFVAINSQINFDRNGKITTRRHPQSTVKIYWTRERCYAHIVKRIAEREKNFIESYSDFVTVNEIAALKNVKFDDKSFLIDDGSVKYYELRNKTFVVINALGGADCFDLFGYFYVINSDDKLQFYNRKNLIKEHEMLEERIEISKGGLFVCVVSANQINMFDFDGNFIYKRIFNEIKECKFLNFVRLDERTKKEIKKDYEENLKLLGNEKDLNVRSFRKNELPLEEKKKAWLEFLRSL